MALTNKEKAFCEEYVRNGGNASRAYFYAYDTSSIADKLSKRQGGNQPIVLQVDGKTFAEISVESINDLTALRGSLPLRLV